MQIRTRWNIRVRGVRLAAAALAAAFAAACAPPAPRVAPHVQPAVTYAEKVGWILRLEDQRILRAPEPSPVAAPAPVTGRRRGRGPAVAPAPPPARPDLLALLADPDARIRRRAALAVGRVGLPEGVGPLVTLLADPEPEVRQMAAFALGLIGDRKAVTPLVAALHDPSRLVQGSAAQALGLIGDPAAAAPIGQLVGGIVRSGALAAVGPDAMAGDRHTEACVFQLGVSALARLHAYAAFAAAVLSPGGQPLVRWWPVAYALQWLDDPRGEPALMTLVRADGVWTRAFAARGLGALKDRAAVEPLLDLVHAAGTSLPPAIEAVRALGEIGDPRAAPVLIPLIENLKTDPGLRLEAVNALGFIRAPGVVDALLDMVSDESPAVRGAALQAVARQDADDFMLVLSGLTPDRQWTVRAALASALRELPAARAVPRLLPMLGDHDLRVVAAVLRALVALRAPGIDGMLLERLKSPDPYIRKTAAEGLGRLKPPDAAPALAAAYRQGLGDSTYVARAAALEALARYGAGAATATLKTALADKDWAVRVKAAELLHRLDPTFDAAAAIRPAPTIWTAATYASPQLVDPQVSPEMYIDTAKGTIEIELAVLDAPLTVQNLIDVARRGFFDHVPIARVVPDFVVQGGDPRGDGDGGPGYTIRDELNERLYAPGTVGMALDWRDTGGSQFFICLSPQPRLDAGYTVFGQVVSGMDVVDRLQPGDVIEDVRIWNGRQMIGEP